MLGCSIRRFSKGEEARGAGWERVKHGGGVMSQSCITPSFNVSPPPMVMGDVREAEANLLVADLVLALVVDNSCKAWW